MDTLTRYVPSPDWLNLGADLAVGATAIAAVRFTNVEAVFLPAVVVYFLCSLCVQASWAFLYLLKQFVLIPTEGECREALALSAVHPGVPRFVQRSRFADYELALLAVTCILFCVGTFANGSGDVGILANALALASGALATYLHLSLAYRGRQEVNVGSGRGTRLDLRVAFALVVIPSAVCWAGMTYGLQTGSAAPSTNAAGAGGLWATLTAVVAAAGRLWAGLWPAASAAPAAAPATPIFRPFIGPELPPASYYAAAAAKAAADAAAAAASAGTGACAWYGLTCWAGRAVSACVSNGNLGANVIGLALAFVEVARATLTQGGWPALSARLQAILRGRISLAGGATTTATDGSTTTTTTTSTSTSTRLELASALLFLSLFNLPSFTGYWLVYGLPGLLIFANQLRSSPEAAALGASLREGRFAGLATALTFGDVLLERLSGQQAIYPGQAQTQGSASAGAAAAAAVRAATGIAAEGSKGGQGEEEGADRPSSPSEHPSFPLAGGAASTPERFGGSGKAFSEHLGASGTPDVTSSASLAGSPEGLLGLGLTGASGAGSTGAGASPTTAGAVPRSSPMAMPLPTHVPAKLKGQGMGMGGEGSAFTKGGAVSITTASASPLGSTAGSSASAVAAIARVQEEILIAFLYEVREAASGKHGGAWIRELFQPAILGLGKVKHLSHEAWQAVPSVPLPAVALPEGVTAGGAQVVTSVRVSIGKALGWATRGKTATVPQAAAAQGGAGTSKGVKAA